MPQYCVSTYKYPIHYVVFIPAIITLPDLAMTCVNIAALDTRNKLIITHQNNVKCHIDNIKYSAGRINLYELSRENIRRMEKIIVNGQCLESIRKIVFTSSASDGSIYCMFNGHFISNQERIDIIKLIIELCPKITYTNPLELTLHCWH